MSYSFYYPKQSGEEHGVSVVFPFTKSNHHNQASNHRSRSGTAESHSQNHSRIRKGGIRILQGRIRSRSRDRKRSTAPSLQQRCTASPRTAEEFVETQKKAFQCNRRWEENGIGFKAWKLNPTEPCSTDMGLVAIVHKPALKRVDHYILVNSGFIVCLEKVYQ